MAAFTVLLVQSRPMGNFGGIQLGKHGRPLRRGEPLVRSRTRQEIFNDFQILDIDAVLELAGIGAIELSGGANAQGLTDVANERVGDR